MASDEDAKVWALRLVALAGIVLAVARFARYVDVVSDTDVGFTATLAWWATWLAGVSLIGFAAVDQVGEGASEQGTHALIALAVGVLILVVMPSSPDPAFEFGQAMRGAFG